jgi:DNA-binding winged helix-turn-helix (wHTH) protein
VRLRFSDFTFDGEARELRRGEDLVPLSPRAHQLLVLLLEARPRPVTQQRLRDALWPETNVGYTSLAQVVTEVRRALGEGAASARFIRTVPRYGYAFVGAVVAEGGAAPSFVGTLVTEQREYLIPEGETLVGRGLECAVRLPSARVSRVHARLRVADGQVLVEDAGSKNGTWVNGKKQEGPTTLDDGDELAFGTFRATFHRISPDGSTRTGGSIRP